MYSFSIILASLHSLNLSFPLLSYFISTAIPKFHLDSLHRHPDWPHFSHFHPDSKLRFQENSYFSSKTNTPLCFYCITLGTKSLFASSKTSSVMPPPKKLP